MLFTKQFYEKNFSSHPLLCNSIGKTSFHLNAIKGAPNILHPGTRIPTRASDNPGMILHTSDFRLRVLYRTVAEESRTEMEHGVLFVSGHHRLADQALFTL